MRIFRAVRTFQHPHSFFEGIGKNVRNESTEPKTPSQTAFEACPTAYKGTPRVRLIHSKKQLFILFSAFCGLDFFCSPVAMHITDASNLCKKPIIVNIGRIWLQNVINVLYSICCNISFLKKQYFGV